MCILGTCYALTYNTRIDQDNTAALLPTGMKSDLRYKRCLMAPES